MQLEWNAIPTARAYFLGSMGALPGGGDEAGMVIWTSSELPDSGMGLFDYQTNAAVDKWLGEKVLLPPSTTRGVVPKEAAGQGMPVRIAYGTELNMAYPPRPTDPKIAWEPDWNVKLRVKSMTTTMMGMPAGAEMPGASDTEGMTDAPPPADRRGCAADGTKEEKEGLEPARRREGRCRKHPALMRGSRRVRYAPDASRTGSTSTGVPFNTAVPVSASMRWSSTTSLMLTPGLRPATERRVPGRSWPQPAACRRRPAAYSLSPPPRFRLRRPAS